MDFRGGDPKTTGSSPCLEIFPQATEPMLMSNPAFRRRSSDGDLLCWLSPFPMCLLVFSIVEFLFTFERSPRQNLFLLLEGSVKPSMSTLREDAWKVSPTRLFSS